MKIDHGDAEGEERKGEDQELGTGGSRRPRRLKANQVPCKGHSFAEDVERHLERLRLVGDLNILDSDS